VEVPAHEFVLAGRRELQVGGLAPLYAEDPRLDGLLGKGGPFEVEEVVVDGARVRSFVSAPRTIVDMFQMGRNHDNLVHIVYEDERLTFREVREQALSLARELRTSFGVAHGDRVAIAMRNLPEFVIGFWAAAVAGAVVVPLNAWWMGGELAYALRDAGAKVVIADEERLERLAGDESGLPPDLHLVGARTRLNQDFGSAPFEELTGGAPLDRQEFAALGPDDTVTILYTSGTTGAAKGAPASNRAVIANLMNMAFAASREAIISARPPRPAAQPVSVTSGPLFHVGGIASIVGAPMSGTKIVFMWKWSVEEGLRLAKAEGATNFGGVPATARQILEHPGLLDLGLEVRSFAMGGASVPPDLPRRALEIFGPSVQIINGYGLTETTSAVVTNMGSEYAAHLDSVGRPNLTADMKVLGPDGEALGTGEVGELCFKSPQNVKGYWNRPDDTRASFVDGWFHSGDLGYVDGEGFVYVVDRLKDVVIRGGENVYCAEVEAVLFEHPGVEEVAIVGLPDPLMGERVCAVVVPRSGQEVSLKDLRGFASSRLAAFKCPEALYLTDELPKTATGKAAKPALRKAIEADMQQVVRAS
jgi:acyl-CoA synthetase (AMP-forming)/AMP-acid ligase II